VEVVEPNTRAALDFLQQWRASGPWVLTAIVVERGPTETRTFTEEEAARAWLDRHNGERNIYFHVNPTTHHLDKKASVEDVAALAWLHVDIDPRPREDLDAERERALALLREPPGDVPPPTVIIFSGGGYQGFWALQEPFVIDGGWCSAPTTATTWTASCGCPAPSTCPTNASGRRGACLH
jgi:hypothetical protein